MSDISLNNKRIAKNTLVLYVRMIVMMLIQLYTSRLLLEALGVDDYGIYNVVGGFVAMFSLLSGALSNAISRFLTFELGRKDMARLREVFSSAVTVQIILATVVVVLAEVVGVWFLNAKMNIPIGRIVAANWVFQCSLATFAINLISVPYNASIIAHEKMTAFAYISILEAVLRLCVVALLLIVGFDRLVLYAVLLVILSASIRFIYGYYCSRHFEECHYRFTYNKVLIKEMTSLAGWNMLGSSGAILNSHGKNLLMNLFFGVKVNAARGLANQVQAAVTSFVSSFTTAVNPQITKTYAQEDYLYSFRLVMLCSRYSYFLMLILTAPIITEAPFILQLWLKEVPEYTILFVRLTLIATLIASISNSLYTLSLATGDIKKYQIIVGSLSLSGFVFTLIFYEIGLSVEWAYYASIIANICILVARIKIVSAQTGMSAKTYWKDVVLKAVTVSVPTAILAYISLRLFPKDSISSALIVMILCVLFAGINVSFIGLSNSERKYVLTLVKNKLKKNA